MRQLLVLVLPFLLGSLDTSKGVQKEDLSARAKTPKCSNPRGKIGDSLVQGCLEKTCARQGKKAVWKEIYASDICCNHDQKWFEMGEDISATLSTDNCTTVSMRCARGQNKEPEIVMDTVNECSKNSQELIRIHSDNSNQNSEKMFERLYDIEKLLKICLKSVDTTTAPYVTAKPDSSTSKVASTTPTTTPSTSYDQDVLFLGPGTGTGWDPNGESEVLNLPFFTTATCTPPVFPHGNTYGYVSTLTPDGPLLCGGGIKYDFQSSCHLLARNGSWVISTPMLEKRSQAASVQLEEGWWVTGGYNDTSSGSSLSSTELYDGNTWHSSVDLPTPMNGHCLVKLNSSHVFLTGGGAASYIYSRASGFIKLRDMSTWRYDHGCGLFGEQVWVGGGWGGPKSTEYYSLSSSTWLPGPALPYQAWNGARMITLAGKLTMIYYQEIWQLVGPGSVDGGTWVVVAAMKTGGGAAIKMKQEDCDNWNV